MICMHLHKPARALLSLSRGDFQELDSYCLSLEDSHPNGAPPFFVDVCKEAGHQWLEGEHRQKGMSPLEKSSLFFQFL